jgi:hypothetical protein
MRDPTCTRRDLLKVGALGAFGLTLGDLFAFGQDRAARARSCILVWLNGGPSHLDMFDLKPEAPREIRGEFKPADSLPGVYVSEHMPRIARRLGKLTLIRSLTSMEGNHDRATHYLLTGHHPSPAIAHPGLGSVVAKEYGLGRDLPSNVVIPRTLDQGNAGYLPPSYNAFEANPAGVRSLTPTVSLDRIERRREMVRAVDDLSRAVEEGGSVAARGEFFEQAYRLLTSPRAKAAFDLEAEPAKLRDAYGPTAVGRGCLLARRLVEAGTRFVTVVDDGWDTHDNAFRRLAGTYVDGKMIYRGKQPDLDQAYSALIDDLESRGLLRETLVILMGEFGRTPKVNSLGGRDHWPRVNSALLAGAGLRATALGRSDAHGELPDDRPVEVEELVWTIYHLLGIDPAKKYAAPGGRPVPILERGQLIQEIV